MEFNNESFFSQFIDLDLSGLSLQSGNRIVKDEYTASGISSGSTSASSANMDIDNQVGGTIQHPAQYGIPSPQPVTGR